jgi:hypothetical protein
MLSPGLAEAIDEHERKKRQTDTKALVRKKVIVPVVVQKPKEPESEYEAFRLNSAILYNYKPRPIEVIPAVPVRTRLKEKTSSVLKRIVARLLPFFRRLVFVANILLFLFLSYKSCRQSTEEQTPAKGVVQTKRVHRDTRKPQQPKPVVHNPEAYYMPGQPLQRGSGIISFGNRERNRH